MVEGLHIIVPVVLPCVEQVDARVHHDSREHDEGRESSLVESEVRKTENEEYPYERHRYHEDDGERKPQRLEKHRADDVDYQDYKEDEPCVPALLSGVPAPVLRSGIVPYGKHVRIHVVHFLLQQLFRELMGAQEIISNVQDIGLVLLVYGNARALFRNRTYPRELHRVRTVHRHLLVLHMPEVEAVGVGRTEPHRSGPAVYHDALERSVVKYGIQLRIIGLRAHPERRHLREIVVYRVLVQPHAAARRNHLRALHPPVARQPLQQGVGIFRQAVVVVSPQLDSVAFIVG